MARKQFGIKLPAVMYASEFLLYGRDAAAVVFLPHVRDAAAVVCHDRHLITDSA